MTKAQYQTARKTIYQSGVLSPEEKSYALKRLVNKRKEQENKNNKTMLILALLIYGSLLVLVLAIS